MRTSHLVYTGAITLTLAVAIGVATSVTQARPPQEPKVPVLQVDPNWPKALPVAGDFGTAPAISTATGKPKPWVTGEVAGTCVNSQDKVYNVHRVNLITPQPVASVPPPTVIKSVRAGDAIAHGDHTDDQAKITNGSMTCTTTTWTTRKRNA